MSFFEFPHTRTYDTDLGWLIKHTKTNEEAIELLNNWVAEYEPKIEDFYNLYEMMISGTLPEGVKKGIHDWMVQNAANIVGNLVKMVFFGITDNGYFVAYIPDSWDEITFGTTGLDDFPTGIEYGHLTLSY